MTARLRVDPIACDGRGLCAELLPEWIELDDWGYPMIDGRPLPPSLREAAERTVRECPKLALRLEREAARGAAFPETGAGPARMPRRPARRKMGA